MQWRDLPSGLRAAVERRTGAVTQTEPDLRGVTPLSIRIDTELHGALYLHGARGDDPGTVSALQWQERVSPLIAGVGPAVVHAIHAESWYCLAVRALPGRVADLRPGSPDLDAITALFDRMQHLQAAPPGSPPVADRLRLRELLFPGESGILDGSHLLHTDISSDDLWITPGGHAYLLNWTRPAAGPAWVDPARMAVTLMTAGHCPSAARAWLEARECWASADRLHREAFVDAACSRCYRDMGADSRPHVWHLQGLVTRGPVDAEAAWS